MRVEAVWRPDDEMEPSAETIQYFRPEATSGANGANA
jgi:hypothetical protein